MTVRKVILAFTICSGRIIQLVHGDITEEKADAIVNAANENLQHGGGVAGAIVARGGRIIQLESNNLGRVPTGQAVITGAGALPASYVIHAVGPVYRANDPSMPELLKSALTESLKLADQNHLTSIAVPAISSGIFGFPKDWCAKILITAAREFFEACPDTSLADIRFVIIDSPTLAIFEKEMTLQLG